jgi:transcriptional regulator with XRE-family HTH domain
MSKLFDNALSQVPEEVKNYVDHSFEIVDQIHEILVSQGKTQRDLAEMLGKKESEISKWMRGTHNFTLKSIAKIESVLGETILTTPSKARKLSKTKMVVVTATINKRTNYQVNDDMHWHSNTKEKVNHLNIASA